VLSAIEMLHDIALYKFNIHIHIHIHWDVGFNDLRTITTRSISSFTTFTTLDPKVYTHLPSSLLCPKYCRWLRIENVLNLVYSKCAGDEFTTRSARAFIALRRRRRPQSSAAGTRRRCAAAVIIAMIANNERTIRRRSPSADRWSVNKAPTMQTLFQAAAAAAASACRRAVVMPTASRLLARFVTG